MQVSSMNRNVEMGLKLTFQVMQKYTPDFMIKTKDPPTVVSLWYKSC